MLSSSLHLIHKCILCAVRSVLCVLAADSIELPENKIQSKTLILSPMNIVHS